MTVKKLFTLTTEQVIGLAPDKFHIRTSRNLAVPEKWTQLGLEKETIWGVIPVNGKSPFFVWVKLEQLLFFCTCNSHKYPCNHLLGLLLLYTEASDSFVEHNVPEKYHSFINSAETRGKVDGKPARKDKTQVVYSNAAALRDATRRMERRQNNISAGLLELELWLHDMIENGLAAVQDYPKSYWTTMADRLVDYQLGEIAHSVRSMSLLPGKELEWHVILLQKVSWLHLLIQGFKRFDNLPVEVQMDLRVAIGWMPRVDDAITSEEEQQWECVADSWVVVGKQMMLRGKQTIQRTWLWGEESNRAALLLDIVRRKSLLSPVYIVGNTIDATLSFAPSTMPIYAQLSGGSGSASTNLASTSEELSSNIQRRQCERFIAGYETIGAAMNEYRTAITNNPWLRQFPMAFNTVTVELIDNRWGICDAMILPAVKAATVESSKERQKDRDADRFHLLPLPEKFEHLWHLQSLSHLQPLSLFGEWDGYVFTPLSVWHDDRLIEFRVLGGTA